MTALYYYVKAQNTPKRRKKTSFFRFLPLFLIIAGTISLGNVVFPLFQYQIKSRQFSRPLIIPLVSATNASPIEDLTRPDNWFVTDQGYVPWESKITHYNLGIPKLGITKAIVQIAGDDLSKSLIHYHNTALPGEKGNTVIFGHSVLPQFFDINNYKTIFSTLHTLKEGDKILVDFDGITYKYEVYKMVEVGPNDISVLEQRFDESILSLITCAPPGTYLRRLVVKSKLIQY